MFRSLVQRFWLVSLFVLAGTGSLPAQKTEQQQEPAKEIKLPPKNVKFKFVDDDGHPIEGVVIEPDASLTYADLPQAAIKGVLKDLDGKAPVSGPDGSVECIVPDQKRGNLIRIWIDTTHDDFLPFSKSVSISEEEQRVVLERGIQIAASAIDSATKQPITENLFGFAEQTTEQIGNWKLMKNGRLISPPLPKQTRRFQLVQIVDGVPIRFSDPADIQRQDGGKLMLNDVPMHPAVKLRGVLSSKVPRPIKNGNVNICVAWKDPKDPERRRGHWSDTVSVAEDGSFEFSGFFSGDWIQLIATCDGWVNEASPEQLRKEVYPELDKRVDATIFPLLLDMKEAVNDVTVEMTPLRTVSLEVLDSQGNAVKNTRVTVSASISIVGGYWGEVTRQDLIAARENNAPDIKFRNNLHELETDANGIARIPDFAGNNIYVYLWDSNGIPETRQVILVGDKATIKVKPSDK